MITITNGARTTVVTKGAYKELYEGMGWTPVTSKDPVVDIETPEVEVEIPLSEMKVSELKDFAEDHGIDISGAKNKRDIVNIIQAKMGE